MSQLGHAEVGEDGVNSYQVYKYFRRNAWRDPPVLLEETTKDKTQSDLSLVEPDSINHSLHSAVQISRVKYDHRRFPTELQGHLLARACSQPT